MDENKDFYGINCIAASFYQQEFGLKFIVDLLPVSFDSYVLLANENINIIVISNLELDNSP